MSTPTKARSKRALPSVPLQRAASTDRIVTGTPKSRSISKRLDCESSPVDVLRKRNHVSNREQQPKIDKGTEANIRSELSSRRKDLSSSDGGLTFVDSERETPKVAVAPMIAKKVDEFSCGSKETTTTVEQIDTKEEQVSTEKKIARVLPMTPWFLEEHTSQPTNEQEPLVSKNVGGPELMDKLKITKLQSSLEDYITKIEGKGTLTPSKNIMDAVQSKVAGTPSIAQTTPQLVDDAEGSSVRVGVRVRPLLPR